MPELTVGQAERELRAACLSKATASAIELGAALCRRAVTSATAEALLGEARSLVLRAEPAVVGDVRQRVASWVGEVPAAGLPVATTLALAARRCVHGGLSWEPNEATYSYYPPGGGVSPHRDHRRYRGVVFVLTLSGGATFQLVADRRGERVLRADAVGTADLVLVACQDVVATPLYHSVVVPAGDAGRWVLTLRESRPSEVDGSSRTAST